MLTGRSGMYVYCQCKGKMICMRASVTEVNTSGRREWIMIFCSVKIISSSCRQLSGPRVFSMFRKLAPDLGQCQVWPSPQFFLFAFSLGVKREPLEGKTLSFPRRGQRFALTANQRLFTKEEANSKTFLVGIPG